MLPNKLLQLAEKFGLSELGYALGEWVYFLKKNKSRSFSQHGEDRYILNYFNGKIGTYIDVGANYPIKISNTFLLYQNGWSGVTIEPIPRLYRRHKKVRPRDTQLNIAVSDHPGELTFHELYPSVLSTFSEKNANTAIEKYGASLKTKIAVEVTTLSHVVNNYLANTTIDLLSVDAEGFDHNVLLGLDWEKAKPQLIIVEHQEVMPNCKNPVFALLEDKGYRLLKTIGCNDVYERKDQEI